MAQKGRGLLWTKPGSVVVEEYEIPAVGSDEVLIQTEVTLISPGTERAHFLAMENTPQTFPRTPEGYNNVGKIIAIGENVKGFHEGERVASGANHASHVLVKAEKVLKVPEGLKPELAVFFNIGAISLQAVRKATIELGESVGILGQGLIGQMASQLSRMSGGLPVISIDLIEYRLSLSRELGSDYLINPSKESIHQKVQQYTDSRGLDVMIEATGNPQAIVDCFPLVRDRGRIILLGSPRGVSESVNFYPDIHRRGISIIGAHTFVRPMRESSKYFWTWKDDATVVLKLLNLGRLRVEKFISTKLPYEKAEEGYKLLLEGKGNILGILFSWE